MSDHPATHQSSQPEQHLDEAPFEAAGAVVTLPRILGVVGVSAAVCGAAVIAMLVVWPRVPSTIAMQWGLDGTPSTLGPAWTWWCVLAIGLAFGVGFPLLAAHQVDRLQRVALVVIGTGLGVLVMGMSAQVVLAQAGADPEHLPRMANVLPSLALACLAALVGGWLFAPRSADPSSADPGPTAA